jgi:hypothetical protein
LVLPLQRPRRSRDVAGMPASDQLYFFRIFIDGIERNRTDGLSFSSTEEVWQEASASAGEIIRDMHGDMIIGLDWRMDVFDAAGHLIFRLSFTTKSFES